MHEGEGEKREEGEEGERENMNVGACPSVCMAGCACIGLCGKEFCIVLRLC